MKESELIAGILSCTRCPLSEKGTPIPPELCKNPKFGVLGEAPGRVEDHTGIPFTGDAGQLMRATLVRNGLDPLTAWWMNTVSCWPRGRPDPYSIEMCQVNLRSQLKALPAKHVLVCGKVAFEALFKRGHFPRARGHELQKDGKFYYPIYHPAYILRNRHDMFAWREAVGKFALTVEGALLPPPEFCLYCGKPILRSGLGVVTCQNCDKDYRRDQQWPSTRKAPFQGSLFPPSE